MTGSDDPVGRALALRRALPEPAAGAAVFADDPQDGLRLVIPGDESWWLRVRPVPTGWMVSEVRVLPAPLPPAERLLGSAPDDAVVTLIAVEYRRLLLERRNAACGTPTRAV